MRRTIVYSLSENKRLTSGTLKLVGLCKAPSDYDGLDDIGRVVKILDSDHDLNLYQNHAYSETKYASSVHGRHSVMPWVPTSNLTVNIK